MMYYNTKTVTLINQVRRAAERRGLAFAQTSSRLSGHYLDACRIYARAEDKGHPARAIWVGRREQDFRAYLISVI